MAEKTKSYRSDAWFDTPELYGWTRRAALMGQGFDESSCRRRPIIGICNTFSELTHCNAHLRDLAEAVKRGVWQSGGFPLEFPVISLGEFNMRPTTMLFRNLMSMDVEESIRANPLDGVVLLGGCDKTTAALLLGAASADVPAMLLTGGPQLKVHWRGEELGSCTDCRRYHTELRAGKISPEDWAELQGRMVPSAGHCMTMGTASTLAVLAEAMGMALPGSAAIPAPDARRLRLAELSGRKMVELAEADIRPSHIITAAALDNAIRALHAVAGSTNAIIHLIALAGRLGIDLTLDRFDELSRTTPVLVNLKPAGTHLMEDFCYAGGAPALLKELAPLLNLDTMTVTTETLAKNLEGARLENPEVIRRLDDPLQAEGGLTVLRGSLAPRGAVIKHSAASAELMKHRGRAVVFEDHDQLLRKIDDPQLDVHANDVLVMRQGGPVGAPGMPEWGLLPIPEKLLKQGVRDMVRLSDARISGTAFGTVVVHVAPESAIGGPLAAVRDGDVIELDVKERRLDLLVEPEEIERRLASCQASSPPARGYRRLFHQHVLQADEGCDFDFLRRSGCA